MKFNVFLNDEINTAESCKFSANLQNDDQGKFICEFLFYYFKRKFMVEYYCLIHQKLLFDVYFMFHCLDETKAC